MRWLIVWLILGVSGVAHADDPETLTARDLQHYVAPYIPDVRSCYVSYGRGEAADGVLRLQLTIDPGGKISKLGFVSPGVDPPWRARLGSCLRQRVSSWHFPVRSRSTAAVMPFLFHRTEAPGAGPVESCWDPRGCPPGDREPPR